MYLRVVVGRPRGCLFHGLLSGEGGLAAGQCDSLLKKKFDSSTRPIGQWKRARVSITGQRCAI